MDIQLIKVDLIKLILSIDNAESLESISDYVQQELVLLNQESIYDDQADDETKKCIETILTMVKEFN
jgi:predicted outer membrane protein